MTREHHTTSSPEETADLAASLARRLAAGAVLALHGDLGAGKTCFVQGLAAGLDVADPVTSPTYTLIQEYEGRVPLVHCDLYRLANGSEAHSLGLDDYLFGGDVIMAIEWPERASNLLPDGVIHIRLEPGPTPDERSITIEWPGNSL